MNTVANTVILEGIVGSKAYGLDTAESDEDRLGVFIAPTREIVGLDWHSHKESVVHHDRDAHHELGKFCRLALQCNPTVTELLWLPAFTTDLNYPALDLLRLRDNFLSTGRVVGAYGGYAKQQAERLIRRGDGSFSADTRQRTAKHGRHCYRLLHQGRQLLTEGRLTVKLTPGVAAVCRSAGELAATDPEEFYRQWEEQDRLFRKAVYQSVLPDKPDREAVNDFLVFWRKSSW